MANSTVTCVRAIIILIVILFGLGGCADMRVLEDLGFIHTAGYDLLEGKDEQDDGSNLLITFQVLKAEAVEKHRSETLTTVAISGKEAKANLGRHTNNFLVSGQFRNALFSMDFAQKRGIWDIVDTLVRDPTIGPCTKLIVVNGSVHEILKKKFKEHPDPGPYIDLMIEKEANVNMVPSTNIYNFTRDLFDSGIDPVLPIIKLGKDEIIIDGIAIFRDDHYVSKLDPKKALPFFFIHKNFKSGELGMKLQSEPSEKKEVLLFSQLISKRKVKVTPDKANHFNVTIEVDVKGRLLEYIGELNIAEDDALQKIERAMAGFIEKSAMDIVKKLQEVNSDALGLGQYVRNKLSAKEWGALNWRDVYPTININVKANVKIRDAGTSKSGLRDGDKFRGS